MFRRYAKYYDILNRDKRYDLEAVCVAESLLEVAPAARTILELGCGTGAHARLLAARGFDVHGIERSSEMVDVAVARGFSGAGAFTCEVADIRTVRLARSFDAVISLFHVVSYQTADDDVRAMMATASDHLERGGVFLFDCWHAPAVVSQEPERRERTATNETLEVKRVARPEHLAAKRVVVVNFDFECADNATGERLTFSEQHPMRYFDCDEIRSFAGSEFEIVRAEEIPSRRAPSKDTWSVTYTLRKL